MNFNIYLDQDTGNALSDASHAMGETRNAIIRGAIKEWLSRRGKPQWPAEVLAFTGALDMPPFEQSRETLNAPSEDPLA
jgi:hypothetical protein